MSKKGCINFSFSRCITSLILALVCLFLQVKLNVTFINKHTHECNTIFVSQCNNNGCLRILSESSLKKTRQSNISNINEDDSESYDSSSESMYSPSESSTTNLIDFSEDECASKCESQCEIDESTNECGTYLDESRNNDPHNRNNQKHYNEECDHFNNSNEENYNRMYDMHNNNTKERTSNYDVDMFDSYQSIMGSFSEDDESDKRNNETSCGKNTDGAHLKKHKKCTEKKKNNNKSSKDEDYDLSNRSMNEIFENLGSMVHNMDVLTIFFRYNALEKNKLFDSLYTLMFYWGDLSEFFGLPDYYKCRQWLKIYRSVTTRLAEREKVFYEELEQFFFDEWCDKESYIYFIQKMKYEWDQMKHEIEIDMKEYLVYKARIFHHKALAHVIQS
ncbi:Pf-fam-b protein [Plasmodium gonderi]|uniref:Pf-fam-b protein n=1 Tax=Plasmodium gonderi TaxID=77519 RepID=A0A1Y1JQL1_PLAGO|nr:Pf-fam-b protein [Plasmodium gonderi]GAW84729.1 Pf-fam-b protein [Plasmodium gonderi]